MLPYFFLWRVKQLVNEYCVFSNPRPVVVIKASFLHHILFLCFVLVFCKGWFGFMFQLKHLKIHKQIHRNTQCKGTNPLRDVPGKDCPLWLRLVGSHYWQRKIEHPLALNWCVFGWGSRIVRRSDQMEQGISFCQGLLSLLWGLFQQWQELGRGTFVGSFHPQLGVSQKHVLPCIATSWSWWLDLFYVIFDLLCLIQLLRNGVVWLYLIILGKIMLFNN